MQIASFLVFWFCDYKKREIEITRTSNTGTYPIPLSFQEETVQTRTWLSVKPPKRVCPSADHAIETHSGSRDLEPTSTKSGLSSSTMDLCENKKRNAMSLQNSIARNRRITDLLSRSKIFTQLAVAAQSQYRLGENTRALTMSPASSE